MASTTNWKITLGAMVRFENIQKIQAALIKSGKSSENTAQQDAFKVETEVYNTSETKEDYEASCVALSSNGGAVVDQAHVTAHVNALAEADHAKENFKIGLFEDCHYIANGMVSKVYRSGIHALKVITQTHNIEPHNPAREVQILKQLKGKHPNIIILQDSFNDSYKRLVLQFPFYTNTLARFLAEPRPINSATTHTIATAIFSGLAYLHSQKIIHRDVKPSNILLQTQNAGTPGSPSSIVLCDFGTAWHPTFSRIDEPPTSKILEVGTSCYRAPETLFGNRSYGFSLDIWAAGCTLLECLRQPTTSIVNPTAIPSRQERQVPSLFESRSTEQDGNQLGLILSMFKTLGTPSEASWPEAVTWKTNPFGFWNVFEGRAWDDILEGVVPWGAELVRRCVVFESGQRITAEEAIEFLNVNEP